MARDPDQIRQEIEATRENMGETVDALAYKTDVKSRTSDWVHEKKDAVVGRVRGATPDVGTEDMKHGARRGARIAEENPLGLALGGVAVGFLAGIAFPSTRVEDEKLGDVADELKERTKETGREAVERGKHVAQEAGQAAMETARETGREQSEEMSSSLRESAQEVSSRTT